MKKREIIYCCCIFLLPLVVIVLDPSFTNVFMAKYEHNFIKLLGGNSIYFFKLLIRIKEIIPAILFFWFIKNWSLFNDAKNVKICLLLYDIFLFINLVLWDVLQVILLKKYIIDINMLGLLTFIYLFLLIDSYKTIKVKTDINNNLEEQENIEIEE